MFIICEGNEWKKTFNTPLGHSKLQALVNDVLRDFLNALIFVYLDDILTFCRSLEKVRIVECSTCWKTESM